MGTLLLITSVSTVTRLLGEWLENRCWIPYWAGDCLHKFVQTGSDHPRTYPVGIGCSFSWVKRLGLNFKPLTSISREMLRKPGVISSLEGQGSYSAVASIPHPYFSTYKVNLPVCLIESTSWWLTIAYDSLQNSLPPDWQPDAVGAFQLPGEAVVFAQSLPQTLPVVILHSEENFDGL